MGGHLVLRAVAEGAVRPDALVLSAPMLGFLPEFLPAHRMPSEDQRPGPLARPLAPECGQVGDPQGEVVDMAGDGVGAETARSGLAAPVGGGHPPALRPPVLKRLEILFVGVAPPRQEQQAAPRGPARVRPVEPPDRMSVGRGPQAFASSRRNGATVESRRFRRIRLANSSLLPVVTIW